MIYHLFMIDGVGRSWAVKLTLHEADSLQWAFGLAHREDGYVAFDLDNLEENSYGTITAEAISMKLEEQLSDLY